MCHQSSCPSVTVDEDVAAEECLFVYCKPVELYNILRRRAQQNPSFLSRCLNYKIKAKWNTRLADGNVIFNYRNLNNLLRKTEVTRKFSCPFCLMRCGSFKGLRCHLITSHDLFKCEFWVTEEYRAINVSVKTDALFSEGTAGGIETYLQPFGFCSGPRKRKRPEDPLEKGKYVYPCVLESALPVLATENNEAASQPPPAAAIGSSLRLSKHPPRSGSLRQSGEKNPCACPTSDNQRTGECCYPYENGNANGMDHVADHSNPGLPVARAHSLEDIDCVQSTSADKHVSLTLPLAAKSRKLSSDRTESRSSALLQKRQFYHSHRAQPMALEQVVSDRDSEDEVDDDIAALEDRRMLDDFVDVTKDEKHLMHLWNSFVKNQRVLADGHVSWACEAFLRLHGKLLVENPALFCIILEKLRDEASTNGKCSIVSKCEP